MISLSQLRRRFSLEDLLFSALLGLLLLLYLAPLWLARYLPMLDLPMHLSLSAAHGGVDEAGSLASQVYQPRGGLPPYLTLYAVTSALAHLLPLLAAMKLVLSLVALGLVGGFLLALRGFQRSRWLVFLIFPLLYDVNATYGYIAFRLSIALLLGSLGLLRRDLDAPRLWRELLLGLLALLVYFTHAHGFALLVVLWGLLTLIATPQLRLRPLLRGWLPLLPALALSAHWYLSALFASSGSGAPGQLRAPRLPLIRLLELIPHRVMNSLSDGRDEAVAIGMVLLWLGLLLASPRPQPPAGLGGAARVRWRLGAHLPELAAALMTVAYFTAPVQLLTPTQQIHGINYRFLILICLLAALIPRLPLRRWAALAAAPAVLLSAYFGLVILEEYRSFDRRLGPSLERVLAAIPPRQRVMAFNYEVEDPRFAVPLYSHLVGYYTALKDGVSSIDQAGTSYQYMPVKLRDDRAHPTPPFPGPLDLGFFAARYDYVLVIDRPGSRRLPFEARLARLVQEAGPLRLYKLGAGLR